MLGSWQAAEVTSRLELGHLRALTMVEGKRGPNTALGDARNLKEGRETGGSQVRGAG